MKTALGIIDVQHSLIVDEVPWEPDALLDRIGGLIEKARAAGVPIVFVTDRGVGPDGSLHASLPVMPDDLRVEKSANNSFENTPLDGLLKARGIERFVVAGLQTDYCINATCRGGAALGYEVTLACDAHSTCDQPHLSAAQVIAEHNDALRALKTATGSVHTEFCEEIAF